MEEIGQIQDVQPIRTASFAPDGNLFAIGTNSKSLKIYNIEHLFSSVLFSSLQFSFICKIAN